MDERRGKNMNMSLDKTALRILSVFNCAAGGIILFLMLMTYAIGLFAVVGTWNLLEPDELLEVLEIGGCSLVLVIPGILMMGEGILTWMAVKDPSRISGACLLSGLMVGVCALPVALMPCCTAASASWQPASWSLFSSCGRK